ncbi:MAG: glyoxylate reductase, partial [Acetomicrobium sp.]
EPPDPSDSLLKLPNFYVTPHIGGTNDETLKGIPAFIASNVDRLSKGELPISCVNINSIRKAT